MNKYKYKLTDQQMKAYNGFQWEVDKAESIESIGGDLCSSSFFHAYHDPLLAILLNPIHANTTNPRLFLVEVSGDSADDKGLKCGYKSMTLVKELEPPSITMPQRLAFGVLCALEVFHDPEFVTWAEEWLNGSDRSAYAANAIANSAAYAVTSAAYAAQSAAKAAAYAYAAQSAAKAAAYAADAAAYAAYAADASAYAADASAYAADASANAAYAAAADASAYAADASANAAYAAADAADAAAERKNPINLIALAKKAMAYT